MDEFLFHIIQNKMKLGAAQTSFLVQTHLVALTANEAARIAASFTMMLMTNVTADAAVDELLVTYPALGELDLEYEWFRPMVEAIAVELLSKVAYGVQVSAQRASERADNLLLLRERGGREERASERAKSFLLLHERSVWV
jgi:hypothetical protein